jgi:hypothetical protein
MAGALGDRAGAIGIKVKHSLLPRNAHQWVQGTGRKDSRRLSRIGSGCCIAQGGWSGFIVHSWKRVARLCAETVVESQWGRVEGADDSVSDTGEHQIVQVHKSVASTQCTHRPLGSCQLVCTVGTLYTWAYQKLSCLTASTTTRFNPDVLVTPCTTFILTSVVIVPLHNAPWRSQAPPTATPHHPSPRNL